MKTDSQAVKVANGKTVAMWPFTDIPQAPPRKAPARKAPATTQTTLPAENAALAQSQLAAGLKALITPDLAAMLVRALTQLAGQMPPAQGKSAKDTIKSAGAPINAPQVKTLDEFTRTVPDAATRQKALADFSTLDKLLATLTPEQRQALDPVHFKWGEHNAAYRAIFLNCIKKGKPCKVAHNFAAEKAYGDNAIFF